VALGEIWVFVFFFSLFSSFFKEDEPYSTMVKHRNGACYWHNAIGVDHSEWTGSLWRLWAVVWMEIIQIG